MSTYKRKKKRQPAPKITEEQQKLFDDLLEALEKTGLVMYQETGNFNTGFCVVDGIESYYINKKFLMDQNIDLMLTELQNRATEEIYLSPRIRNLIEVKNDG